MVKYIPIFVIALLAVVIPTLAFAQLTPEQELGQKGIDFLESLGAGWAVAAILVARQVAEIVAKMIPDSATGFLGILRKVAKFLAAYVPNKA